MVKKLFFLSPEEGILGHSVRESFIVLHFPTPVLLSRDQTKVALPRSLPASNKS